MGRKWNAEEKELSSIRWDKSVKSGLKAQAEARKNDNFSYDEPNLSQYQVLANEIIKCWLSGKPLPKVKKRGRNEKFY